MAIATLVCRRSRYIRLILPGRLTADDLVTELHETLAELPESGSRSLDHGWEMASHDQIAVLFAEGVFFAHAGKPWQRPTNENSNGLLHGASPNGATSVATSSTTSAGSRNV